LAKKGQSFFRGPQAEIIADKLGATIKPAGRHKRAYVEYFGTPLSNFGLNHDRTTGHGHIPKDLHVPQSFVRAMAECKKSAEDYYAELRKRGLFPNVN
jgi:hypothetical protein